MESASLKNPRLLPGSAEAHVQPRLMRYFQPERRIVIDKLAPREAESFLDLGCACGHVAAYVARTRGWKGVGVEVNIPLLAEARTYYPGLQRLVAGSGTALPLASGLFDVVFLLEVLEHVPDQKSLIEEVLRVLKPGGWLILSVPNRSLIALVDMNRLKYYFPWLHRLLYRLKHAGHIEGFRREETHHRHYSADELTVLLRGAFEIRRHLYSGSLPYVLLAALYGLLPDSGRIGSWKARRLLTEFETTWGKHSANLALAAQKTSF